MQIKDVMTLEEAAAALGLNPHVVRSYFDSGRLRGFREPGSGERRVAKHHLMDFVREHGFPPIEDFPEQADEAASDRDIVDPHENTPL